MNLENQIILNSEELGIRDRNRYAEEYFKLNNINEEKIEAYIKRTIDRAHAINYYQGIYDGYRIIGILYVNNDLPEMAINVLTIAEEMIKQYNLDPLNYLYLYSSYISYYNTLIGDSHKAAMYCKKGIEKAQELDCKEMLMKFKSSLGMIHVSLNRCSEALELLEETFIYHKSKNDTLAVAYNYTNMGEAYLGIGLDERALTYYNLALKHSDELNEPAIKVEANIGIAKVYSSRNEYKKAINLLEDVFTKSSGNYSAIAEAEMSIRIVMLYIKMENYVLAYEKLVAMGDVITTFRNQGIKLSYYKVKAELYEGMRNYKEACYNYKKYHELYQVIDKVKADQIVNDISRIQLNKTIERLDSIAKIGRKITMLGSEIEVLQEVGRQLNNLMDVCYIGIGQLVDNKIIFDKFLVSERIMSPFEIDIVDVNSLAAWSVRNQKDIIINDVDKEYKEYVGKIKLIYSEPGSKETASVMYTPLIIEDKTMGVITVQSNCKNVYLPEDLETLRVIASYVAIALINAKQANELKQLSIMDNLTGVLNRRGFFEKYEELGFKRKDNLENVAMMMIDLDFFKTINDRYGHITGDQVLVAIGKILKEQIQSKVDIIGRLGGEEFAILMTNSDVNTVNEVAELICKSIEALVILKGDAVISVTTSIGIFYCRTDIMPIIKGLYNKSDQALYYAKNNGRNKIEFCERGASRMGHKNKRNSTSL